MTSKFKKNSKSCIKSFCSSATGKNISVEVRRIRVNLSCWPHKRLIPIWKRREEMTDLAGLSWAELSWAENSWSNNQRIEWDRSDVCPPKIILLFFFWAVSKFWSRLSHLTFRLRTNTLEKSSLWERDFYWRVISLGISKNFGRPTL